MSKPLSAILFIAMGISCWVHGAEYQLTAMADIEAYDGTLKSIITSSLVHVEDGGKDTFTLTAKSIRLWMEPRNEETEERARQAGTPIDGTEFAAPEQILTFMFDLDERTNAVSSIRKDPAEQSTIDLINLLFFDGARVPIRTENLAVMMPEYAKEFKTKVSGYDITLYVHWYDSLKRNKDKEAPTYLLFVADEEGNRLACRAAYQAVKTTSKEVAMFNLCSTQYEIDLNEIVRELNGNLGEIFQLRSADEAASEVHAAE